MRSLWTITQACTWIATKDERLVNVVSGEDLVEGDITVSARTPLPDDDSSRPSSARVSEALPILLEALKSGAIQCYGRAQGTGNPAEIPAEMWSAVIADPSIASELSAPKGRLINGQTWWDLLRVWDMQAMMLWRRPRRRQSANIYAMDFLPDSLGEAIWKERRQRMLAGQAPMDLVVGADGLPDRGDVTLVEALSWRALGKALPVAAWSADMKLEQADEAYAQARNDYANALYRFREARRQMKASGERHPSEPTVIGRGVAAKMAVESREREKAALAEFRLQASWRQLVYDVYEEVRTKQNFPADDMNFAQRLADRAEQELFSAFLRGELVCLGRKDAIVPAWEALPKDYFRFPIGIRLNHNILEPMDQASIDDHKMIMEHIANWVDLRVGVADLRRWAGRQSRAIPFEEMASVKGVISVPERRFEYVNLGRLEALRQFTDSKYDLRKLVERI